MESEAQAEVQLPQWQSHKRVYGDRIKDITSIPDGHERISGLNDTGIRWSLDCGGIVTVTSDLIARGSPQIGDYFVQYDDGYKSWSPAKAFEEGYTRLT